MTVGMNLSLADAQAEARKAAVAKLSREQLEEHALFLGRALDRSVIRVEQLRSTRRDLRSALIDSRAERQGVA